jgi:hypothetical protein
MGRLLHVPSGLIESKKKAASLVQRSGHQPIAREGNCPLSGWWPDEEAVGVFAKTPLIFQILSSPRHVMDLPELAPYLADDQSIAWSLGYVAVLRDDRTS